MHFESLVTDWAQVPRWRTKKERRSEDIKYIVIHDTGNPAHQAGVLSHIRYFMTTDRKASCDFIVDDVRIAKINDFFRYFSWHCGGKKPKSDIFNSNSVGIELCINTATNPNLAFSNLIKLTACLMIDLQVPLDRVVRHYDATGKICPGSWAANGWEKWFAFKSELAEYHAYLTKNGKAIPCKAEPVPVKVSIDGETIELDGFIVSGYHYIKLRDLGMALGYEVTWDPETRKPHLLSGLGS